MNEGGGKAKSRKRQSSGAESSKEKRFKWPNQLHIRFIECVFELGLKNAEPTAMLECMPETPGLTGEHIKSYLQKYRLINDRNRDAYVDNFSRNIDDEYVSDGGGDSDALLTHTITTSGRTHSMSHTHTHTLPSNAVRSHVSDATTSTHNVGRSPHVPEVHSHTRTNSMNHTHTHTLPASNAVGSTSPVRVPPGDEVEFNPVFQQDFLVQQICLLGDSINVLSTAKSQLGHLKKQHDKVFLSQVNSYKATKLASVLRNRHHTHASNEHAQHTHASNEHTQHTHASNGHAQHTHASNEHAQHTHASNEYTHHTQHTHARSTSTTANTAPSVEGVPPTISPRRASTQSSRTNSPVPQLPQTKHVNDLQHTHPPSGTSSRQHSADYVQSANINSLPQESHTEPMAQGVLHQDNSEDVHAHTHPHATSTREYMQGEPLHQAASEDVAVDNSSYPTAAAPFTNSPARTLRSVPSFNAGQRTPDEQEFPYADVYTGVESHEVGPGVSSAMGGFVGNPKYDSNQQGRSGGGAQFLGYVRQHQFGVQRNDASTSRRPPVHTHARDPMMSQQQIRQYRQHMQEQQRLHAQHMHMRAHAHMSNVMHQRSHSPAIHSSWIAEANRYGGGVSHEHGGMGSHGQRGTRIQREHGGDDTGSHAFPEAQEGGVGMDIPLQGGPMDLDPRIHHPDADGSYDVTDSLPNLEEEAVDVELPWLSDV